MQWLKPSIEAANHRYILAVIYVEYEDETCEEMHILAFDGIRNRWKYKNEGGIGTISLSDLKYYIPIPVSPINPKLLSHPMPRAIKEFFCPDQPYDITCLVKQLPLRDSSKD